MSRGARRERGIVRNLAHQLANMATGWQVSFDGPVLLAHPDSATISIDAVTRFGAVDGVPCELGMAKLLHTWLEEEVARLQRDWSWIQKATVTIEYCRRATPFAGTNYELSRLWSPWADHGEFQARAAVSTATGVGDAVSHNHQALLRVLRRPTGSGDEEILSTSP